jgi:dolichol-phosphate mannosyltransferase
MPSPVDISVVLPTYNEAASIIRLINEVIDVLERQHCNYEILLVDDNSPDGTGELVRGHYAARERVQVVSRTGPRGLALSIRDGLERARGSAVVVMDADFNHDPQVLPYLIKYLADFDLVSGSRFAAGGGMYDRKRQVGSFIMNLFIRIVLQTQIQDNLSGYFAIRRAQLERLPKDRIFWGYGDYYFRLLSYAQHAGFKVLEIPVVYRSREGGGSKTPLTRTAFRYAWQAVVFRLSR